MTIMLDTDVLVSVIFFPSERTRKFVHEVSDRHHIVLCDCVIRELETVVERKLPDRKTAMEQFLIALPYRLVTTDGGQGRAKRVLNAAIAEDVDMLISGDRAMRSGRRESLRILTMSEFLGRMLMRKMLSWKMVLRARLKTALTLLLITASTFLFLYNLLEYTMTNRQYQEAMAQYWGNLTLDRPTMADGESTPDMLDEYQGKIFLSDKANPAYLDKLPYEEYHKQGITGADIEEIMALPYVDDISARYMTAGVSDKFTRIDTHSVGQDMRFDFNEHSARMVIEATVEKHDATGSLPYAMVYGYGMDTPEILTRNILVSDVKVLAGDPVWLEQEDHHNKEGEYRINYTVSGPETIANNEYIFYLGSSGAGTYYQVNHMDESFKESLIPGERYVFVCRVETKDYMASGESTFGYLYLGDDSLYNWWPYAYDITDLPADYIEGEEFAPLRELIQITNDDIHTMDVIYTEDMRTIRRYQEGKLLLMEGRLLNEQDTADKNPVCLVCDTFAEEYDLEVGDKISLRLGDKLFENYAPIGAVAGFRGRYADNFTEAQDFEIVGIYHETGIETLKPNLRYWAYSENAVFVPQSFLPVSDEALAEWEFSPADVSLIVSNADNITAFANEVLPVLSEMGYVTYYSDLGWPEISKQLKQTGLLSLLKLITFSVAVVLVLLLTMYLFVIQRKKEFAVMRALGCPKRNAVTVLLFPLSMLAVLGVALGAGMAVCYTTVTLTDKLQSYAQFGHTIDGSIPVAEVLLSIIGCFALLMIFAAAGLMYIARMNPLELLQGGQRSKKRKIKKVKQESTPAELNMAAIRSLEPLEQHGKPAAGFMRRYILRHARRSLGKSLLLVLVTALLFGAMGQFAAVRDSYRELYRTVDVKVRFLDFEHYKAKNLTESEYVTGGYFEYNYDRGEMPIPGSDRRERVYGRYCLSNNLRYRLKANVTFLEGYSEDTVMDVNERICIMPRHMMERLGAELGDIVELNEFMFQEYAMAMSGLTEEEGAELYHRHSVKTKVVGCIETGDDTIYIPLAANGYFKSIFHTTYLSVAEFSLSDYHKALELQDYAKTLLEPTDRHQPRFSMDTAEADRVYNTYQMIETLYPIAFATAVLIGAIIVGLLILQRAKEAATLRVLGTTKSRTRSLLTVEQILLCILGIILALAVLVTLNGAGIMKTAEAIGLYIAVHVIACLVGCVAAAVSVTKHKALELLQVKE